MRMKKLWAMLTGLALAVGMMTLPASAATAPGVYTASMVTSYYNPDTGNVDDGGTANAALGEGMCRSATDTTALVEVDANGTVWVTVRLLLQSNCSNVVFYTRGGYDSYSQVSYDIISEDAGNDSIDYRFKVTEPGQKLKCTMYVSPMGRDVLWYLYVDTSTLTSGSGDFIVSIDTAAAAEAAAKTETPAKTESSAKAETPSATAQTKAETKPSAQEETPAGPAAAEDVEEPVTDETPDASASAEDTSAADASQSGETAEEPDRSSADEAQTSAEDAEPEAGDSQGGLSGGVIGLAAAIIVVAAAVFIIRGKKK